MFVTPDPEPIPASLRVALDDARETLRAALPTQHAGGELLQRFSERIIELITPSAAQAVGRAGSEFGKLAIVVLGGLARGEHCPHSDLDLVVVCTRPGQEGDERFGTWIREFTHPLWDAGLRLRTTVHRPEGWLAAASEDLSLCTALLDMRFIAGDRELVDDLVAEGHRRFFGDQRAAFLQRLVEEMQARQRRYGTTVYTVEPDLKFGPGGARDIAIVEWALMSRRNAPEHWPEPWDLSKFAKAVRASGVPRRVARLLAAARDAILRLRAALHFVAGRTQDRLNFQYQEGMPAMLGLLPVGTKVGEISDAELVAAIEASMQDYYRAARDVLRYGGRVFARCQPPRLRVDLDVRIDERFHVVDGRLRHFGKDPFADTPVLGLDAIILARDHNIGLSGPTLDAIAESAIAIPEDDQHRLAAEPEAQRKFLDILVDPRDVGTPSPLELCHEVGLLERIIPEFAASRGRMQHEGIHVYTVDQHSLYAVEFLKAIARGDHRKDFTMATAVHLGIDDPRPLYLATLLHDAGKPFGDQLAEGRRIARLAADRAEFDEPIAQRCAFLVAEHQTMPMLSQKRDLTDELLIREFAEKVRDRLTLDELYLVSLADMANVSPEYLTSWKLTLLDELYLRTAAEFANRGRRETIARRPRPDEPEGLPPRYYSLFDQELRREHRALLDELRRSHEPVLVDVAEGAGAMRLTVVTLDRRGLLATLTAGLAEIGLEVVAADIFTVPFAPELALDVFRTVPRDTSTIQRAADWAAQVQHHLAERLAEVPSAEALREPAPPLPSRQNGSRRAATKIRFSEDPAGFRTIVDVETIENPGVAARISRSFAALDLDIEIARINTEMRRVDAVFYVGKLNDEERSELASVIRANLRTRGR
jgi:[protein-PII] uridylyltransferase